MRQFLKKSAHFLAVFLIAPFALTCWLENKIMPHSEVIFQFWSHLAALFPGLFGVIFRRAFYTLTVKQCSQDCYIGFGSLFTHRDVIVDNNVYMGNYVICGAVALRERTIIASRVSITSGKHLHRRDSQGQWASSSHNNMTLVEIGPDAWIGEGAIIMADIGKGSLVGAGAVVTKRVPNDVVAAGNPAVIIKEL
jgi:virginiamycin A acetyltransferase